MNEFVIDVLLVEDNLSDAELTIRELRRSRMANNVIHVKDGEEALDFLFSTGKYLHNENELPRMILLDIHLPKLNGIEVLEIIRADARTKSLPVVILTASNQDPDIHHCYELGVNSYIVKPMHFDRFAEAIQNLGFYWLLLNQPPTNIITYEQAIENIDAGG